MYNEKLCDCRFGTSVELHLESYMSLRALCCQSPVKRSCSIDA